LRHFTPFAQSPPPAPPIEVATCPAGLPGTPDAAATGANSRKARKELSTFKSEEGEFSILLPFSPQHEQIEHLSTPYGPMKFLRSTAETMDGLYEISYGDVPGTRPIDNWLTSTSTGRLQHSKLIERHDIKLNGVPGSAYTASDDQYYWSERIYFVGRRLYRITAYFPRSACNWPPYTAVILNSFRTTHPRG
jgi:hypothetical protein